MSDDNDSIADLMVETCETGVRTTVQLIRVPLEFYADMVKRCAKAVENALREFQPRG